MVSIQNSKPTDGQPEVWRELCGSIEAAADAVDALADAFESRRLPPPSHRRRLRRNAGATLEEVAAVVGVSTAAVSRWENGLREPPVGAPRIAYGLLLARFAERISDSDVGAERGEAS